MVNSKKSWYLKDACKYKYNMLGIAIIFATYIFNTRKNDS